MLRASNTLGNIARIGGTAFGEQFLDKELPAAIILLEGVKQEFPRYAGVLILKELARNSPIYFHTHISLVFDKILMPLRDPRVIVREGAAELLAVCLEIIDKREEGSRSPYLFRVFQDAQMGLRTSQPHIIHGSLLTYRELLLHGGMVGANCQSFLPFANGWRSVHERHFPRHCRANLPFQIRQRRLRKTHGNNDDSNSCSLRHPNFL